ncbi:MAG: YIP1 family protein [Bacilli bacterium]|nr:YIP1 family protein [Bacilli bacterium]
MKKVLQYLSTFIIPKKMEVHRDMNLFVAVLLFLLSAVLCAGIGNFRLKTVLKNGYLGECYSYEDTFDLTLENFDSSMLPSFTMNEETYKAENIVWPNGVQQSVYNLTYKAEDGLDVNMTLVYEFDKTTKDDLDFDLNAYLQVNPYDGNGNLISRDILVVYTQDIFYYIFNRGYTLGYKPSEQDTLEAHHYLNVEKWALAKNWSMYKVQRDTEGNIVKDTNGDLIYLPNAENKEYTRNINQLFTNGGERNVGIFSYLELDKNNATYTKFENPLHDCANIMINTCKESVSIYGYILSFFYVVVLPILWVFVIWLLMRKNAEITRFREYYSICAASFLFPSLIGGIVTLFVPYTIISRIIMIAQAVFYFIVVSRINAVKTKNPPKQKEEVIDVTPVHEDIKTRPVQEVLEDNTENRKPSIIE